MSDQEPIAEQAPPRRTSGHLWLAIALIPPVILLLFIGLHPFKRSVEAIAYPYQIDPEEGFLFEQAIQLAKGRTIYPDISGYPYTVGNYPPVYPAMWAGLVPFAPRSIAPGRLLATLATLVIVALLLYGILRETGLVVPSLLGAGLFLATWDLNDWIAYARVDLPAIAFGLAGLIAITSSRRWAGLWAGVALFTLAFFTKQTQIVAPAAVLVGMLWRRETTRAGIFCIAMLAAVGITTLALQLMTGGEFLRHTVLYNMNVFDPEQLQRWIHHIWFWGKFKIVATALLLMVVPAVWRHQRWIERDEESGEEEAQDDTPPEGITFTAYLIFATLSVISIGKEGAAANYLLEFNAAIALFVGVNLGLLVRRVGDREHPHQTLTLMSGLTIALFWFHALDLFAYPVADGVQKRDLLAGGPTQQDRAVAEVVYSQVLDATGPVLCEEPVFNILAGQKVLFQPFIMSQLAKEKKWDESGFVKDLIEGKFDLIVTSQDLMDDDQFFWRFTPNMRAAIKASYVEKSHVGRYFLYVPKDPSETDPDRPWIAALSWDSAHLDAT
ncbi:DUF2029 domain-containing protein [bacterium]|nr:DUF2029 domain-containing protein [bacterium]